LSIEGQGSPIQVNIPNLITMFRIFMVPLVVWLIITEQMAAAFWVFLVAGLSDGIDGFIAKRFGQETLLGAYLDPLADKALLVSIYVTLGLQLHIPNWLVIMVVSRDILIVSAVILSWMLDRAVMMRPLFVSKANTTGQIVLAGLVLLDVGFGLDLAVSRQVAIIGVAVLTVASAIAYLVGWLEHMAQYEVPPPRQPDAKPRGRLKAEPPHSVREKSRP